MSTRQTVLAVTSELPWPLDRGGHIRSFHLLSHLAREFALTLVVPVRPGQDRDLSALRDHGIQVEGVPVAERSPVAEALKAGRAFVSGEPYVLYRRHDHHAVRQRLQQLSASRTFDIGYLDHLDSFVYARAVKARALALDMHNVYSLLLERTADEQARWIRRTYLRREARLLGAIERRAVGSVTVVFAVSESERAHFEAAGARHAVLAPNGVDCAFYATTADAVRPTPSQVLYIATMSWAPNAQAADFLARQMLPELRRAVPDAELTLIGRHPPQAVLDLARLPGVRVLRDVEDVRPYLSNARVLAVPLEAGGGTRLKILEAFAAGVPVVSTPIGAEGIEAGSGDQLVIAPRSQFAAAVSGLLFNAEGASAMARRARSLVEARYDWSAIGQTVCRTLEAAV